MKNSILKFICVIMSVMLASSMLTFTTLAENETGTDTNAETSTPSEETTAPDEDTTGPEEDTEAPGEDTTVPEDDTTAPEKDSTLPDEETTTPDENTEDEADEADIPLTGISINKTLSLTVGESKTLSVTYLPENTTDVTEPTWSSSNEAVATVSTSGRVRARGAGTATITVICNGFEDTCTVTVTAPTLSGITLNYSKISLKVGKESKLSVSSDPTGIELGKTTWSSSNEAVATVNGDGKVTAVSAGTATITAKCEGFTATCKVTVNASDIAALSIKFEKSSVSLEVGKSTSLKYEVSPEDTTDAFSWQSSDKNIVSVSDGGKITAIAKGTATITVTVGECSAQCTVTVTDSDDSHAIENFKLSREDADLTVGSYITLEYNVSPFDTEIGTVMWYTTDKNIITVDNGVVTAVGTGTATVVAICGDVAAICKITVIAPAVSDPDTGSGNNTNNSTVQTPGTSNNATKLFKVILIIIVLLLIAFIAVMVVYFIKRRNFDMDQDIEYYFDD